MALAGASLLVIGWVLRTVPLRELVDQGYVTGGG